MGGAPRHKMGLYTPFHLAASSLRTILECPSTRIHSSFLHAMVGTDEVGRQGTQPAPMRGSRAGRCLAAQPCGTLSVQVYTSER